MTHCWQNFSRTKSRALKPWAQYLTLQKLGMAVPAWNPQFQRVEKEGSGVQGHSPLHGKGKEKQGELLNKHSQRDVAQWKSTSLGPRFVPSTAQQSTYSKTPPVHDAGMWVPSFITHYNPFLLHLCGAHTRGTHACQGVHVESTGHCRIHCFPSASQVPEIQLK